MWLVDIEMVVSAASCSVEYISSSFGTNPLCCSTCTDTFKMPLHHNPELQYKQNTESNETNNEQREMNLKENEKKKRFLNI